MNKLGKMGRSGQTFGDTFDKFDQKFVTISVINWRQSALESIVMSETFKRLVSRCAAYFLFLKCPCPFLLRFPFFDLSNLKTATLIGAANADLSRIVCVCPYINLIQK